jgi:hypothetical protein
MKPLSEYHHKIPSAFHKEWISKHCGCEQTEKDKQRWAAIRNYWHV